ncbi:MAG: TRAP transporter large permease [Acidobacteria bacterium]|nr:TRAP transporter large permease [Acidobacteriota bacterium]
MNDPGLALLVFGSFVALLILRVPVAFSLGLSAFVFFFVSGLPAMSVVQKISTQIAEPTLLAIPFFILCGEIMSAGGMARRLIELADALIGFVRGGLAMVNVVASMFFGGMSGSSVADTAAIGTVLIPTMVEKGYGRDFSVAVTVASSTQGIILPPSHNAILYSLAAGGTVSIQSLFLAGYVPGILVGLALMLLSAWLAKRRGYPRGERVAPRHALRIAAAAFPALITPLIIIVPLALGWAPAHQAALIAVVWSVLVSSLVYRTLALRDYVGVLRRAVRTSGMVMILIGTAAAFGEAMTYLHVPELLAEWLTSLPVGRLVLLLILNVIVLALGAIMDMAALIVILTPILLPVAEGLGLDPVQFGIILLLNLGIGLITPPVGSTLFVGCAIGNISIESASRALLPFYFVMLLVLMLVTFVPGLSLWLPNLIASAS